MVSVVCICHSKFCLAILVAYTLVTDRLNNLSKYSIKHSGFNLLGK